MRQIRFPDGTHVAALGQGTWKMGVDRALATAEAEALNAGIDAGMTMIDTAEMYGEGATETFLGTAIGHRREEVFLVSKAYPQNASRARLPRSCEASLKRLKTDRLDLYLLHWKGSVPLGETVEAMEALKASGKIKAWGVSNFDASDMDALVAAGGEGCATNQVLYNVSRRGPEHTLLGWLDSRCIPLTAYSPVEQGRLRTDGALARVAGKHEATAYQIALAWAMRDGAIAIPKAGTRDHVEENRAAVDLTLDADDLATIDASYPPPKGAGRLEML